ncbi:MAG TPA: hypothetical protein VK421_10405 [Pyrinomonadaceae bacterium]|nr:hypothetical protein [Pyrinomonadaceae bacterium]
MDARRARRLALIPWLSLPAVLVSHAALWGKMPPEIAVHFTPSGRPVTSVSRAGFLLFSVAALLAVLVVCTWKLRRPGGADSARLLLRYYFTVAAMVLIYFGVLIYNAYA